MKVNGREINYSRLPEGLRGSCQRWIENGIPPGDFLMAVICNDLFEAYALADSTSTAKMRDIVMFFYNDAPSACYGSLVKAKNWRADRTSR